jgi:tetratricopeptide (TPR) repeat protein
VVEYTVIEKAIESGYDEVLEGRYAKGCDIWLRTWEDIKEMLKDTGSNDWREVDKRFHGYILPSNMVMDLTAELHNAGIKDSTYFSKCIEYCEELLAYCGSETQMIEETRNAIADSYYDLNDEAECDRLYEKWLTEDPTWGAGYIGWSDHYGVFPGKGKEPRYDKAERIISRGLTVPALRNRDDVVRRAIELYGLMNNKDKIKELRREILELETEAPKEQDVQKHIPVRVEKIGRNEPCPCGSGKKYKKCCGA